jgi:hypothetical protein
MPNPSILLQSGNYFDLLDLAGNKVLIEDIAHGLSHICRFTGHTWTFYSVAQHSVLASYLVPKEDALAALLHDAAEAYIGDISRPLKQLLPDYKAIEARIEADVFRKLGLPPTMPESVKRADMVMLATEQRDLMPSHNDDWACLAGITPLPARLEPWDAESARTAFLIRYKVLRTTEIMHKAAQCSTAGAA